MTALAGMRCAEPNGFVQDILGEYGAFTQRLTCTGQMLRCAQHDTTSVANDSSVSSVPSVAKDSR